MGADKISVMFKRVAIASLLILLSSCQSPPEVVEEPVVKTPQVLPKPVIEPPPPTARQQMSFKKPKSVVKKAVVSPVSYPPNTITTCPAGLNGAMVGSLGQGRHCFTNEPEEPGQCLGRNDEPVRIKAEAYCQKLKSHWEKNGQWSYGADVGVKLQRLTRSSCQCGLWRGKPLCKSFFQFRCETYWR